MQFWWVNQNQTFKHERDGGFLWAPKRNINGARNPNYDFLQKIEPGDVIFSFVKSQIVSIALAEARAVTAPKPDFGPAGMNWQNEGWRVDVAYSLLTNPIRPKDYIGRISSTLHEKYSPLNQSGNGIQAYFFPVGVGLLTELIKILDGQFESALKTLLEENAEPDSASNSDDPAAVDEENKIQQRLDIGETQREQLVIARRGQGVFRTNVRLVEKCCRVTGLTESRHLVASHIKPWSKSSDLEKLDGSNGLLLSPHIDHLFDKGFISFSDQGDLLTSQRLREQVLTSWHLDKNQQVGKFSAEQSRYLEYHRDAVFKSDQQEQSEIIFERTRL